MRFLRALSFMVIIAVPFSVFAGETKSVQITADAIVDLVIERNFGIKEAVMTVEESREGIPKAKSVFDTNLAVDGSYQIDKSKSTSPIFGTRTDTALWGASLTKEVPIGTVLGLSLTNMRTKTYGSSIGGTTIIPSTPFYEPTLGLSLSQPLMQNVFGKNDRSSVDQAKLAYASTDFAVKRQIDEYVWRTLLNYWSLIFTRLHIDAQRKSVSFAEQFLSVTLGMSKLGTAEETDVLAAKANLLARKNELLNLIEQERVGAEELRRELEFEPGVDLQSSERSPKLAPAGSMSDERLAAAFENRGDYQATKRNVERLNLVLSTEKNKRWPKLDLYSTLSLNEIDTSYESALSGMDSPDVTVGMQFSVPLENRAARAGAKKAQFERARAVYSLKNLENSIVNEVATSIDEVNARIDIVDIDTKALELNRKKLAEEMKKYDQGRSSSEMIVLYQNDVISSERRLVEAWLTYTKAMLDLKLAEGLIVSSR